MPLTASALESAMISELEAEGFVTDNQHAMIGPMVKALSKAVVNTITADAEVQVPSGSSAGKYKVK
ncbi:hypothetical protein N473_06895 [Pseudoalteromonas luteoviolacea CPMOR-1]|uniref:Uncharacterized protein n=1 Tax=Pseudoalteromonas luteoviolacea CPMOR-1 TaxID=1365248 RepID=A0A167H3R9_9GAMM|nr:hypothetical protein [Pseudoalteromonas luteoviolacea]KZN57600.1 hypothetical protein N473_06895 [Pseudoalteromonas luteoviolacea CPMOR-1]